MKFYLVMLMLVGCTRSHQTSQFGQALFDAESLPLSWVAIGDSTTADYSNPAGGWPNETQRAWTNHAVDNIAVPGSFVLDAGPSYPSILGQWLSVKGTEPRGLLQHGGYNDLSISPSTGDEIFLRMLVVAEDALDAGWTVALVSPLPCGGSCTMEMEGKRLVVMGLQEQWAAEHGLPYLNLDHSLANCQNYFGNGIQAFCVWARNGGTDCVHPSAGAQAAIGTYVADRMMAPQLLDP